jgi:anti-sigma regulatory factor (Ser/Thr protein kinase)
MAANHTRRTNRQGVDRRDTPFPRFHRLDREMPSVLPPSGVVSRLQMRMRPGPEAAGEGRHALDRLAGVVDSDQLDTLRLLVTELITNAVRHGGCAEWIELDVAIYRNSVRGEVLDCGSGFEPPAEPQPHPDRPGGWGLCLVDQLADRWGVALDDATRVWFEVGRSSGFAAA